MKCVACGEEVETAKIGENNWSAGCDCWTAYSIHPKVALGLYRDEMALVHGPRKSHGVQPPPLRLGDLIDNWRKLQLVGPADC